MTGHRRGVALTPMETRRDVIVRTAALADELGYELFAVPEGWGLDSAPVLAEIAMHTTRIQLARLRHAAAPHARSLTVAAGPLTVADEDPATARNITAACAAWYLSAMGDVYARSLSGQGYAAEVRAVLEANPRPSPRHGNVPAAAGAILDQLAAYGTGGQVREQLQAWDHAADIVVILLPPGLPWHNIEATLLAAAPSARPARRVHARG